MADNRFLGVLKNMEMLHPVSAQEAYAAIMQGQQQQAMQNIAGAAGYGTLGQVSYSTQTTSGTTMTFPYPIIRREPDRDLGYTADGRAYGGDGRRYPHYDESAVGWLDRRVNELRVRL